jgi:hypothetical protein
VNPWIITFSGADYDEPTGLTVRFTEERGLSPPLVYDDVWLARHPFRELNRWLFDHPGWRQPDGTYKKRGLGWYSWKPLIILDALDRVVDGDVVLYVDGDTYPIADLSPIYEYTYKHGAMFFKAQSHDHRKWCKAKCFDVMGQGDLRDQSMQAGVARFCAFKKGDYKAKQFLWEWLTYAVNPVATTFDTTVTEHPEFVEHRTEQAIMTNLCYRYGYPLHREADQSGEGWPDDRDLYGQLFVQVENLTRYAADSNGKGSRWRNV